MAINLTTKYSPLIDERFKHQSITDAYSGKKYSFDGAQSIKVYTIDKVSLNNYNRAGTSGRFGTINELGDTIQTLTMSQDKAFTFSIDAGNAADQMNIKHCNEQLKSNWDEVCTPEVDKYRLLKWASGAGLGAINSTALAKATVMEALMTASAALSNKLVPKKNRVVFISETVYIATKLATEIVGIDSLGAKAITNGVVGHIDAMAIVPVPDSYLPKGVNFIIKYKDSTVDPMKLKTIRVQKNPLGFDADVGECRFYHDSFVLDNKVYGIYVHAKSDALALALTNTANKITFASTSSTGVKYTVDGSNPKTSPTVETILAAAYATGVTLTAGQSIRCYAYAANYLNSPIMEDSYQ